MFFWMIGVICILLAVGVSYFLIYFPKALAGKDDVPPPGGADDDNLPVDSGQP